MAPVYDLRPVRLPRLAGIAFRSFVNLLESRLLGSLLAGKTFAEMGVPRFRSLEVSEAPTFRPIWPHDGAPAPLDGAPPTLPPLPALPPRQPGAVPGFRAATASDYVEAYRAGRVTPDEVADRALAAIAKSDEATPPLRAFVSVHPDEVRALSRASTERWRRGEPFGELDGVPVAVKDELDLAGHATTVGTRFLGGAPKPEDATAVARWRAAGALILGKTNMHEIGIGVTGFNRSYGTARNPHAPGHYTGGSSSGSAAAVASGLCPLAMGADAGGSIRVPSAFCGLVGLKPTYARVSARGTAHLAWSVDHYGPIASSTRDVALGYALMAGPDPNDRSTFAQPSPTLQGLEESRLEGLSLGVFRPWFEDADEEVVRICRAHLDRLADERGLRIVEIEIPELGAAQIAHLVLVAGEMSAAMETEYRMNRRSFGLDVRANLALARDFTTRDYVKAQRVRTRAMESLRRVFEKVDAVVTPATGVAAPAIRPDALPDGESDLTMLLSIMRFVFLANLTGHPAVAFPAGSTKAGLPVGLQAIGRPWEEHVLLRLARSSE
ncbi:MAG TPA: amidase, partial [Thermoanaerobaculia bacterium]|nr:amidase [Thermoanaerobaculia bacterium]